MTSPDASARPGTTALTDQHSRRAATTLALSLPGDSVLYLLLPLYTLHFGVSLAEAGLLLAANRLVRIVGYGAVARFYARHGDRSTSRLAAVAAMLSALGYALLSGFWALLPLRLLWGLAFAALNLSTQAMATADPRGAARRNGRARAFIAMGPMLALPLGAWMSQQWGPRVIFFVLAGAALAAVAVARGLPDRAHPMPDRARHLRLPGSLDIWSFLEGFTLDGLFIIGLTYLGKDISPTGSVFIAAGVMALRYLGEIVLSPIGGRLAERVGPLRLLVSLSLLSSVALVGFGAGWIWSCATAIVVLRALQLPLLPPIVMMRTPGPERVQALATREVWRDIGAGIGPLLAGLILPSVAPIWTYGIPALLLALAALACMRAAPTAQPALPGTSGHRPCRRRGAK